MWTIVRATPIRGVANFLFITMAFLVADITRAAFGKETKHMSPPSTEQKSKDKERVIVKPAKVAVDTVSTVSTASIVSTQDTEVSRSNDHIGASVPNSRMAWYLLIFVSLWLFGAMAATAIILCYTRNLIGLSFFTTAAPPVLILLRITKTLFPPGRNETKIALAKQYKKRG